MGMGGAQVGGGGQGRVDLWGLASELIAERQLVLDSEVKRDLREMVERASAELEMRPWRYDEPRST
jgi:hypothetical protein